MAGAFTRSKLFIQFSYAYVNFKVSSESLLQCISCITYRTAVCINAKVCLHVYHIATLVNATVTLPTLQGTCERATI